MFLVWSSTKEPIMGYNVSLCCGSVTHFKIFLFKYLAWIDAMVWCLLWCKQEVHHFNGDSFIMNLKYHLCAAIVMCSNNEVLFGIPILQSPVAYFSVLPLPLGVGIFSVFILPNTWQRCLVCFLPTSLIPSPLHPPTSAPTFTVQILQTLWSSPSFPSIPPLVVLAWISIGHYPSHNGPGI